jgi:hypothetical protein
MAILNFSKLPPSSASALNQNQKTTFDETQFHLILPVVGQNLNSASAFSLSLWRVTFQYNYKFLGELLLCMVYEEDELVYFI